MFAETTATIPCGKLFGIRFISKDENFTAIQIISNGIDNPVGYHVAPRPKKVVMNQPKTNGNKIVEKKLEDYKPKEEGLW